MQPQDIRLRLLVRRHGLPEVKLVWPCSCSEDLTIAKLLEQVNEVVPLESGEWGLEDYAVELADGKGGSFECLHFQQVGRILKDEDQVLIRSLLTGDLKRRRLSGRHQISDDGRHLVDGLAFGRSWIRAPHDRPHVELPPRKRIRVNYEDEDDDEEEEEQEPFLIGAPRSSRDDRHQNFRTKNSWEGSLASQLYEQYLNESSASGSVSEENELEDDIDDEDEIEDYTDEEDEDEAEDGDLETELQLLREEAAADVSNYAQRYSDSFRDDMRHSGARGYSGAFDRNLTLNSASQGPDSPSLYSGMFSTSFTPSTAHGYASVPVEVLITVFQTAFPTLNGEIRTALKRTNKDLRKAYMSLTMLCEPSLTFDQMMDGASLILAPFTRRGGNAHLPRPTVEDETSRSPLGLLNRRTRKRLIEEVEEEDEVGCSPDTSANGVSLFVSQLNQSQHTGSDEIARADLDEVDEDSAEDDSSSDSESDSSDNSLDSGSSSEEEDRQMPGPPAATYPDGDEPSDVDEESSDDDSDSSVDVGAQSTADHVGNDEVESSSSSSDASSSEPSESDSVSDSDSTSGDSESESESEDESESKSKSESASEVEEMSSKRPVPATVAQSTAASAPPLPIQAPQVEDSKTQTSDKPPTTGLTRTQKRNARRRRIKALKELHSDQAELTTGTAGDAAGEDFLARKKALLAAIIDEPHEDDTANDEAHMRDVPLPDKAGESGTMAPDAGQAATPELKDTPAKRHSRIDMGAGRRLVFGALGLKPPANKSDEQKIRDTLMKDVRPLVNPRTLPSNGDNGINEPPSNAEPNEGEDEDQDAWREKINYRAVECCHEDMVLSEPPFPFVQRWDPQQRRDVIRKRKRASENYEADDSYIDSTYYYDKQPEENHPVPETRKRSKTNKGKSVSLQIASPHEDEEDVTLNYDEAPPKSSQFTDVDDLPSLPKDVKSLPPLAPGTAKPGMVITWNQLVMSKATNWQPEVMPLTGLVVSGGEEGEIHVILARRDREDSEKTYDEVTGERVYGKFEVPDLDEEDQEEDSGLRSLKWTEMMEPRLLQQAPADVVAQPAMGATEATVEDATSLSGQNKVSEPLSGEDGLDSGLSTGEVRAALEDELMHDSFGTQANLETFSIQSGQQLPRLDASMSEVHISTASNSFEHVGHAHSKPDARSEHVLIATSNLQKAHSPKLNHWVERDDEPAADREAELGPSLADAMAEESSNTLASKRSDEASAVEMVEEGDGDEGERGSTHGDSGLSMAKPSDAVIASSHFSVASGRQPQTSYSIHAGLQDETIIPETLPQPRETTPMQSQTRSQTSPSSRASSSPFPSLEQIFMSAQPTQSSGRKNESPSMSASLSAPARDAEYEEAMRKLDEGHESDVAPEIKKQEEEEDTAVERKLFPNATQPPSRMKDIDEGVALPQLPLSQAEKGTDGKPPFFIPAGSQVIVLSSSPPSGSGVPDEDHETMEDKEARAAPTGGSLPTGPGWVRKGNRHERQVSSAKKADATTASPRSGRRTRRGNEPLSMTPLVSPLKKNTGRRGGSSMWQ
ncbi:hypothetical protein M440DRAFT_1336521 [Trichoderma longibrachiatum ATCC 18648]|uniref:DUF7357 domain-containing protein n=1 Tax=Trichoderma longibrachiatum ATCC 18648 TaxID=983965 RepID=A0A2T4C070_TRILO|nr:hypothetical protein M440DRAFT_1336521 [Trichoderma longibrachiatum ATCC 18648]